MIYDSSRPYRISSPSALNVLLDVPASATVDLLISKHDHWKAYLMFGTLASCPTMVSSRTGASRLLLARAGPTPWDKPEHDL
jgi:hypothetical protein